MENKSTQVIMKVQRKGSWRFLFISYLILTFTGYLQYRGILISMKEVSMESSAGFRQHCKICCTSPYSVPWHGSGTKHSGVGLQAREYYLT